MSVVRLLVTVVLSVVPAVVVLLLFPLVNATIMMINTAAPTIHTHGWAYQVSVVVVVVVVDFELELLVLSCAQANTVAIFKTSSSAAYLDNTVSNNFFINVFLG
jgi:hypothetical protein